MSNKRKVISWDNLPTRFSIANILIVYLLLENLNAPEWVYVAWGIFYIIQFVKFVIESFKIESIDIFKETVNTKIELNFDNKEDLQTFLEKLKKYLANRQ